MVLIDALFINKGGGAVLLQYLIERILARPEKDNFFFLLDPRFEKPDILDKNYVVINNSINDRIKFYKLNKNNYSKVFCFANTPPPVKLKVPAYTYFHNQKLLEAPKHKFEKKYFFLYLKYLAIKLYNRNTDYYIVQTPHMVHALTKLGLKNKMHCLTIPFYDDRKYLTGHVQFSQRVKDEFVFISNPSPQKNYPVLLDAWEYLLENGYTPKLHVTIDDTAPQLLVRMEDLVNKGARISNHVYLDPRELYFNCPFLIFPSVTESFGLPLIEAVDSGMKVIASDLDYVHDVIVPSLTFDPHDRISIANAVIQALEKDLPFPRIVTSNEVERLISLLV
ncbi:MAG: glycosyl transferase group 1 [Flavipsychrobacter sp.]|jgi:glycosyltransferase involved in cell wall biosynthesis|nr:glycosyl transferase group 1 [Flavipsychrobacter sp.]